MSRVYRPTTLDLLAEHAAAGRVPPADNGILAEGDDEVSEHAALMTAADSSAALLDGPGRRVVLVAEVADPDAEIPWRDVVAVHADADSTWHPDDDLGWYAVTEIDIVLG